ncbi:MAG: hypothetical protein P1V36_03255 [Planctomycetota bacterium]|nr:hypothetical protein [Planctomycetota bacterium]
MGPWIALLLVLVPLLGPCVVMVWRSANAPALEPADPVRPICVIATIVALLGLLMPLWTLIAGTTDFDPLGILEPDGGLSLLCYVATVPALIVAWSTNGGRRATQNTVLAWLHGGTFLLLAPSFYMFVMLVVAYDSVGHT